MRILERQVKRLARGKFDRMQEMWAKYQPIEAKYGVPPHKRYRYLSGEDWWTIVLEREWESMAAFEATQAKLSADAEYQKVLQAYADVYEAARFEFLVPVPPPA